MLNSRASDLASRIGGIVKHGGDDVLSAVDKYEKYHVCYGGEEDDRKSNYTDMVNKYYDLVTRLYEFGWGESFHFAHRWKGESFRESIKRHEHFLALQLGLKPGQKVLDVGCGIGGPLREISRFSSTSITGLNINVYQIARGKELNRIARVDNACGFVKADFMKMPFPDNSFDAIYAIEATCHAPDVVIWDRDLAADSPVPWYFPMETNHFSFISFRLSAVGRFFTQHLFNILEFVRLAPKGSLRIQYILEKAAQVLVEVEGERSSRPCISSWFGSPPQVKNNVTFDRSQPGDSLMHCTYCSHFV